MAAATYEEQNLTTCQCTFVFVSHFGYHVCVTSPHGFDAAVQHNESERPVPL